MVLRAILSAFRPAWQNVRRHRRGMAASAGGPLLAVAVIAITGTVGPVWREPSEMVGPPVTLHAPRVVVLKSRRTLYLFDGEALVRTYPIDLGAFPEGEKVRAGDGRTPVGTFRAISKNASSPYHRFIGIDYPDAAAVSRGLASGLISPGEAASIRRAHEYRRCPNWRTALGGGVGIHGGRRGHDWTGGCIALTDEHVEELFSVLRLGDPIEILP